MHVFDVGFGSVGYDSRLFVGHGNGSRGATQDLEPCYRNSFPPEQKLTQLREMGE